MQDSQVIREALVVKLEFCTREGRKREKDTGEQVGERAIPSSGRGLCEVRTLSIEPLYSHY